MQTVDVQQGGVLREPMGFIGPTYPQPLSSTVITNPRSRMGCEHRHHEPQPRPGHGDRERRDAERQ